MCVCETRGLPEARLFFAPAAAKTNASHLRLRAGEVALAVGAAALEDVGHVAVVQQVVLWRRGRGGGGGRLRVRV